jgi:hypothetical protein
MYLISACLRRRRTTPQPAAVPHSPPFGPFATGLALLAVLLPGAVRAQGPAISVLLPGYRSAVAMDTVPGVRFVFPQGATRVLDAAATALAEAGVPPVLRDSSHGVVGNLQLQVIHRLGPTPLSRIVDCGPAQGGQKADFYRVHLALVVRVGQAPREGATMVVQLAAGAQALGGPLADPIGCSSTGALEERLRARVEALLARLPGNL